MNGRNKKSVGLILLVMTVIAVGLVAGPDKRQPAQAFNTNDLRTFVVCEPSYNKQVDPIVAPGMDMSSHMHTFFGSLNINKDPDYDRITKYNAGESNCDTSRDTAGYWVPTAINPTNGNVLSAVRANVYYVNPSRQRVSPLPPNFQAVSDDFEVLPPGNNAEAGAGIRIWFRRQCWDGTLRMASPAEYRLHTILRSSNCPAGYTLLPKIHFNARFGVPSLAGYVANTGSSTVGWHGDLWNTWDQPSLVALTTACMNVTKVAAGCGRVTDANFNSLLTSRGVAAVPYPVSQPSPTPTPPPLDPAVQAVVDAYNALSATQQAEFLNEIGV